MNAQGSKSGSGCLKGLGVGCGSCAIFVVVLFAGVWFGWETIAESGFGKRIRSTVETVKSEGANMMALRAALVERTGAAEVGIHAGMKSTNGVTVKTLELTLTDPQPPVAEGDAERRAREIAAIVVAQYPSLASYDQLRLALVRSGDGGADLGSTATFQFDTKTLLGAGVPATPAP